MGFSRDANGWSIATPSGSPVDGFVGNPGSGDTRKIYVSDSDGSDTDGTGIGQGNGSKARPYKTIAKGISRMRPGCPDQLLLANGDRFGDQFFPVAPRGGSPTDRMVYASYDRSENSPNIPNPGTPVGAPMPLVLIPVGTNAVGFLGENCAIMGIDHYCYTRDPSNSAYNESNPNAQENAGFFLTGNAQTIEDCNWRFFHTGGEFGGDPGTTNEVRRCRITDSWNMNDKVSCGMSTGGGTNYTCTLEQNLFDVNGYNPIKNPGGNQLNHNIYANANNTLIPGDPNSWVWQLNTFGNIISREDRTAGCQHRCGGHTNNNFWYIIGTNGSIYRPTNPNAINRIENEVSFFPGPNGAELFFLSGNEGPDDHGGYTGYKIPGMQQILITNCIAIKPSGPGAEDALFAVGPGSPSLYTVNNNIAWKYGYFGTIVSTQYGDVSVFTYTGYNIFATSNTHNWLDPNRTPGTYMRDVIGGGNSDDSYFAACRLQHKNNWNPLLMAESVNDYLREGFNVAAVGSAYAGGIITPPPPNLQLSPTTLPNGTVGVAYNQTITASGGTVPYTLTVTGALPAGLSFNSGAITGTPTTAGTSSFTVNATDSQNATGSKSYTITIAASTTKGHPPHKPKPYPSKPMPH